MINSSAFADRKCRHQQVGTSVDCQLQARRCRPTATTARWSFWCLPQRRAQRLLRREHRLLHHGGNFEWLLVIWTQQLTTKIRFQGCTSGECQTWYHISRIPKQQLVSNPQLLAVPELCEGFPVYEIVKNRDFDKCKNLPVFNYISTPGMQCDVTSGASCQNEWAVGVNFASVVL